ncbi:MAG: molybdenum cofactor guanylyltransferase [Actinomycetota bacterium]
MEPLHLAGLLLTGGTSRRMGADKATLEFGGSTLASRVAAALREVAYPVLAVGPPAGTGLDAIGDPSEGPLVAFVAGADALAARVPAGTPVLLVACDLPFVTADVLRGVALAAPDADACVPVTDGRDQPLCARYSQGAVAQARALVREGARAMRDLLAAIGVSRVDVDARALVDVDTPQELDQARRILDGSA